MPKRTIIEVQTNDYRFEHASIYRGPYIDVEVAKRYKHSPLNVCHEEEGATYVLKGTDENQAKTFFFDASANAHITARSIRIVNTLEHCLSYNDFKLIAGKHGSLLGEIWCAAEMLDLQTTMRYFSRLMQSRVMGKNPIYKNFLREVLSSERSDAMLTDAIINFYQNKLGKRRNVNGISKIIPNTKITIEMIGEHHWVPDRVLEHMFFKVFNSETKVRRFDWLVKTLRWFPVVKRVNEKYIAVSYHNPTYLTYTLWPSCTEYDDYKFTLACKILDKYLTYDFVLPQKNKCKNYWQWLIRWGHKLPVSTRMKLLDNIERHGYRPLWIEGISPIDLRDWNILGQMRLRLMSTKIQSALYIFMEALGCKDVAANLYVLFIDECNALITETEEEDERRANDI